MEKIKEIVKNISKYNNQYRIVKYSKGNIIWFTPQIRECFFWIHLWSNYRTIDEGIGDVLKFSSLELAEAFLNKRIEECHIRMYHDYEVN